MLTEITVNIARERLTSCSPALFWEVLGQMQVPPFVRNRVKAYDGENAVVLRHPLFQPGPPFQDSFADDTWAVCALREADEEVLREMEDLLAEIRSQMREGDLLEICIPGKMPESWEAQIQYYSAVGTAGKADEHIRPIENEVQDLDILSDYFSRDPSRVSEDGIETARSLSADMVCSIEDLVNTGETAYRFFGWWEGDTLAGAVSFRRLDMVDAVLICNIYVLPRYRRQGIARTLLAAALSLYPGEIYTYSHISENVNSGKTALSAGFIPVGSQRKIRDK